MMSSLIGILPNSSNGLTKMLANVIPEQKNEEYIELIQCITVASWSTRKLLHTFYHYVRILKSGIDT